MPLLLLGLVLLIPLLAVALMPLALVQRYRAGTARRLARGWVIGLNLVTVAISVAVFLVSAAVATRWVPGAFSYTLMGLAGGCVLGVAGLGLTRWDATARSLHYTPNRALVLAITVLVSGRVLYGFWRTWQLWSAGVDGSSLLVTAGLAGSMAAGAVVLGYYLTFWAGLRHQLQRHRMLSARGR